MDIYQTLKSHARQRRDREIEAARQRYNDALNTICKLQYGNGHRSLDPQFYNRGVRYFADDVPLAKLTLIAAAERVLREGKPLRIAELVIELQDRGFRADENPRRLGVSIRSSLTYHRARFVKDRLHRWSVV
jgi:hypothetical protein